VLRIRWFRVKSRLSRPSHDISSMTIVTRRASALAFGCVLGVFAAELALRLLGNVDEDGQFSLRGRAVRPYRLPVAGVAEAAREYVARESESIAAYDSELGWVPRADFVSTDERYAYDSGGLRVPAGGREPAGPSATRVAFFGDSYVHGDDVVFEDSFPALVGTGDIPGVGAVEILNFGVFGYGLDQALLRFERDGVRFEPDVVVVGFQATNLRRNINLIRPLLHLGDGGLPFAKPRFVLDEGSLHLIGAPTPTPLGVPELLKQLSSWELREKEYFYVPDSRPHWWQASRLASLVYDVSQGPRGVKDLEEEYAQGGEMFELGMAIFQRFRARVEAADAKFLIVHLPRAVDLREKKRGGQFAYEDFLAAIGDEFDVVCPEDLMLETASVAELYDGHYSRLGNELVARAVRNRLGASMGTE